MFKGNRIGTPNIHEDTGVGSVAALAWSNRAANDSSWGGNVINGTPRNAFGYNNVNWAGAATITSANRTGLFHAFTVTKPLAGDVVGIELAGHLTITLPQNGFIIPLFGELTAAPVALFDAVAFADQPVQIEKGDMFTNATAATYRNAYYRTQVITKLQVGATYAHGFGFVNFSGANYDVSWFSAGFGVRQFTDLEIVSYADPLR